ncbi:MAG: dynamin family protein [Candidatus Cloacimonadia bacterium]
MGKTMIKVCLAHNPYLNDTRITIVDGERPKELSRHLFELVRDKRLQYWLEDFFPSLADHLNVKVFELSFKGIEQDYNDLVEELKKEKYADYKVNLKHIGKKDSDHNTKVNKLKKLFEKATQGPIKEFKEKELSERFLKALSPEFEMCVLANMSAGKSTFINSILGKDLLPSKNQACTATITTITDYDELKSFRGRAKTKDEVGEWRSLDAKGLRDWNKDEIKEIEIQGNIPMIKSENIRLVLVDTPGTNSAENLQHRDRTLWSIKNEQKSLIIYLLDSTSLATTDDQNLLQIVSKEMHRKGKQSVDRFLFVLNKVDSLDPEKESINELIQQAQEYLKENSLKNALIYPVSARATLLMRSKLNGESLTRAEDRHVENNKDIFNKDLFLHQHMPLTPSVRRIVDEKLSDAKSRGDEYEIAMINSGIPVVEAVIQEYLNKYALPMNIYDAKMTFDNILSRYRIKNEIDDRINNSRGELDKLNKNIKEAQKRVEKGEEAKKFRKDITEYKWVKSSKFVESMREKEREFNRMLNAMQYNFGRGEETRTRAVQMLIQANDSLRLTMSDIHGEMNRIIEEEVVGFIKSVELGYNKYVKDLLGGSLEYSFVFENLTNAASLSFDIWRYIVDAKSVRKEVVGEYFVPVKFKLFKPSTWFRKKKKVVQEAEVEYVNMGLLSKYFDEMRAWMQKAQDKAEKAAIKEIENNKKNFMSQMERVDQEMEELLKEYNEKTSSVNALEESLKKEEGRRKWLEGFQAELEEVLSI